MTEEGKDKFKKDENALYDDEVRTYMGLTNDLNWASSNYFPLQIKERPPAISNAMREKLIREASTGLDSDQKQSNVLLYIILGVAVLVILGGQGILF